MPNLPIISETIPDGSCPETYNELAQLFASHFFAVQGAGVGKQWIFSAAKPTLDQTDYGWFQLDDQGLPIRPYLFAQGLWLSRHPTYPGQAVWVFQDIADITAYDGGSAGVVSLTTGPMWQYARATDLNNTSDSDIITAKFPITKGTLPSGTVLNTGDTGGEESHSLTEPEMPPHTHVITTVKPIANKWSGNESGAGKITTGNQDIAEGDASIIANNPFFEASITGGSGTPPVVTPHNTLPPYIVGILIQRTNRLFYAINA